jgi:NADH-quinone oxidoreductase subunit J
MLSSLLFYFFSFFGLISSFFVVASINPVYSVLFLVSTFICFSCLIFSLGLDFIPIILIIVYVGAVAILFLFVVMMLDIKIAMKNNDINKFAPFF